MVTSISIITPVFNDIRVGRALQSILDQEHDQFAELIVVDGGSDDGTPEVLESYSDRLTVLISEPDDGIYDAMNKGIARATGDVVGILNADDRYAGRGTLSSVLRVFEDPTVQACYGNLGYIDDQGQFTRYWKSGSNKPYKWRLGWMPPHPTFFVRRQVYKQFGDFDTRLPIAADYELMLRLLMRHRIKVVYIDEVLVHMATGGKSSNYRQNFLDVNRELVQAWRQNNLSWWQLVPFLKQPRKAIQWFKKEPIARDGSISPGDW